MVEKETIKRDFSFLSKREDILAILLFGSRAKGVEDARGDTDVCIVAPACKERFGLLKEVYRNLDVYGKKYDVRIFEDLPLHIKMNVIEFNEEVYTKDPYGLYEYFYIFRKFWEDQARRQKLTKEEIAGMF